MYTKVFHCFGTPAIVYHKHKKTQSTYLLSSSALGAPNENRSSNTQQGAKKLIHPKKLMHQNQCQRIESKTQSQRETGCKQTLSLCHHKNFNGGTRCEQTDILAPCHAASAQKCCHDLRQFCDTLNGKTSVYYHKLPLAHLCRLL